LPDTCRMCRSRETLRGGNQGAGGRSRDAARSTVHHWIRTEVPLPIQGDLRAWDQMILGAGEPIGVEAETRLTDTQAVERKIALKMRDGGIGRVLLVVSSTRGNRLALREAGIAFHTSFPIPGRVALRALEEGRDPGGSAVILV
jgi:hypothetical protein